MASIVIAVITADAAIFVILPPMTSSSTLLKQLKSSVTWSHLVCTDQMESISMELQSFPGRGGKF